MYCFDEKGKWARMNNIHFIGVGGVGMYSLAKLSLAMGKSVSGSDREENPYTRDLSRAGAAIHKGHEKENVYGAGDVVYTLAINDENPELVYAREHGLKIYTRAEYMGEIMKSYENRIGISGSHGKSTTTAMAAHIFDSLGYSPTIAAGAPLSHGMPCKIGGREHFIYEACEYRDSFLKFFPSAVAVTNIELDHTDYFRDIDDIRHSFLMCINRAENFAVLNADDENVASLFPLVDVKMITYGAKETANYRYSLVSFEKDGIRYKLFKNNKNIGEFYSRLHGVFNISNAVCAITLAAEHGIAPMEAGRALEDFRGIDRRMELVGSCRGMDVIYDYAHHPTEIREVINALKLKYPHITVIFKPHTYTRTRDMWDDFASALSLADNVIITDIYPAREAPIEGITEPRLAEAVGSSAIYIDDENAAELAAYISADAVVLMGAGANEKILKNLLTK